VPVLVIGNTTVTPTANPIGLPVFNGTTFASTTGTIILPSGNLSTSVPLAFLSKGSSVRGDGWVGVWVAGCVALGVVVWYL